MKLYEFTVTDPFAYPFNKIWDIAQDSAAEQAVFEEDMGSYWPAYCLVMVDYVQDKTNNVYTFEVHRKPYGRL